MKINIVKVNENAKLPTRGSDKAAGYDLYACTSTDTCLTPNQTVKIGTGIAIEIPDGYVGLVFARSGIATNRGLRPANCVGVIDSDYRGEIIVPLHNDSTDLRWIKQDERIAQIVIVPFLSVEFNEVETLGQTERGNGGFGSTGAK